MQTTHLLHTLYLHQQQHRYISDQAIIDIAKQHDLPRAQVESVTEFYSFFYRQPIGLYHILFSNCTSCGDQAYHFSTIYPEKDSSYTSHAMTPSALLYAFQQVYQQPLPLIFLLRIRGYQFELGSEISEQAQDNLNQSLLLMRNLFYQHRTNN